MKKILILLSILFNVLLYSQAASKINNAQNILTTTPNPPNFLGADGLPDGTLRKYDKDAVKWETYNINGLASYIQGFVTWSNIIGKPTFATVATSGDYNDLFNKPSIYSFTGLSTQYTKGDGTYVTFPTTVSSFSNDVNYVTSSNLTSALSNYVTNSSLAITLGGYATTSLLTSGLAGKENSITAGTTSQYWRGDKTWQTLNTTIVSEGSNLYYTDIRARASNSAGTGISYNSTTGVITNSSPDQTVVLTGAGTISVTGTYPNFTITNPVSKRQLTFTGTTDNSGNYTITFSPSFSVAPNIQASIANQGGNTNQFIKVVSSSTTGATVNVFQRSAITLLGIEVLLAATTNVNGATVDILVTEK